MDIVSGLLVVWIIYFDNFSTNDRTQILLFIAKSHYRDASMAPLNLHDHAVGRTSQF